ncbi:MAG: neutral zinc metallopeptidase [Phycisphaerae bacterium]
MRWRGRRQSSNVEDRRRMGGPMVAKGGGLGVIIIVILYALLGGDPQALVQNLPSGGSTQSVPKGTPADDEHAAFISTVLADTEDVWNALFEGMGDRYVEPTLVLFRDQVQSACGYASSASGPFYCPGDEKVYLDLSFFDELKRRFNAPGDFAQAYVVAHEVGHHVQRLLGTTEEVHRMKGRVSEEEYNAMSVRLELQADFFAGVWAHHAQRSFKMLEPGDIEEALRAASAIGDDAIQKRARGYVVPESFTHGTSAQRVKWFKRGFETGDLNQGDTFEADDL